MSTYKPPFVRSAFNFDTDMWSLENGSENCGRDMAIQSGKDDADINVIVKRFGLTGQMPRNVLAPMEGDFSGVTDFQDAMNVLTRAQDTFMLMPPELRAELGHDPQRFVAFCSDDKNRERLKHYGLLRPGDPPVVPPVVPVAELPK